MLKFLGGSIIPIMVVLLAVAFVLTIKFIASRYKKIPPGRIGIFYGRKYKTADNQTRGYTVITGGGRVLMPLVESYLEMPTTAFQVPIEEDNIPNKDNVKLSVKGVATCKISTDPTDLSRAIESLIDKQGNSVQNFVQNILKGHVRGIIGKMSIDELMRERDEFNKKVTNESTVELKQLGIEVQNLVIQEIEDTYGYIDALGQRAVADAKAEAQIKIAEANRRQEIEVSNAQRESKLVQAGNAAKIAEAEKFRDIQIADFKTETDKQKAIAEMAMSIASAAEAQKLKVAEAVRDAAAAEAQVKVQEAETNRRQKELEATQIVEATAAARKTVIDAEALQKQRIIAAEADAEVLRRTAEAKRNAMTLEGEGEANKNRAILLATAEGKAAEKKQALLAEAEGTRQLADALSKMTTDARLIVILDKLPLLFDKGGDAMAKVMQAIFASVAAPLGQIDKVEIIDVGGNGKGMDRFAEIVPQTVFNFIAKAKAQGMDFTGLLRTIGADPSRLQGLLSGLGDAGPETVAEDKTER